MLMRNLYSERDYVFGQAMLTLRTEIGLTQAGLANKLCISRRAVGEWEAGNSYPKPEHLKKVIALAIEQEVFPIGHEVEEIRELWRVAHQKILLDEHWLSILLSHVGTGLAPVLGGNTTPVWGVNALPTSTMERTISDNPIMSYSEPGPRAPVATPRVDWGDALAVPTFYGREDELALLSQWVVQERTSVVSVLGMGGIGKSALSVSSMHRLSEHFDVVIFRSLRNAPSCEALLEEFLQVLAPRSSAPEGLW